MNKKKIVTLEDMLSLHRYYVWSSIHFKNFEDLLRTKDIKELANDIHLNAAMCYWYAALYVVVEGWEQLNLKDPVVDQLIASSNLELLKRFRNGVFHYQNKYHDDRFGNLIVKGNDVAAWVRTLHKAVGDYLLTYLRAHQSK